MNWEGLNPPYSTIVADPPWPFMWNGAPGGRRRNQTRLGYSTMTIAELHALPVGDLAADAAHLYLWATSRMFREGEACRLARAWGFVPRAEIVWRKRNFGAGAFPRIGHEFLVVCARDWRLPFEHDGTVHSVQDWPQVYDNNGGKGHSRKPAAALDLVEQVSPGPYVELFARAPRLGWDSWGHGYEGAA